MPSFSLCVGEGDEPDGRGGRGGDGAVNFRGVSCANCCEERDKSKKRKRVNVTFTDFFKNVQLLFHNDLTRTIVFSLV